MKIVTGFILASTLLAPFTFAQTTELGRDQFEGICARCHGGDAQGGETGPSILAQAIAMSDEQLKEAIRLGNPEKGMPAFDYSNTELNQITGYIRSLVPLMSPVPASESRRMVTLSSGEEVEGVVLNAGLFELQLRTNSGEIYLLREDENGWRRVSSQEDWPTYHGTPDANRYSSLTGINKSNVKQLSTAWTFPMTGGQQVETTPLVVDGVMYVSSANEVFALDAGSGRELWHFQRPKTRDISGLSALGINRGVAISGDKVFLQTDNVHILALDKNDGQLIWDTTMADYHENYEGTAAPLVVGNLVVSGVGGGDSGVRGFVAAYDVDSGEEVWRRWTIPLAGEPGSETWQEEALEHGAGATWMTGSYDADLGLVYWPVGNPGPDFYGDDRMGDNLWTNSILALNEKTGEIVWYFQFTPHDIHDWDAQEPPVLIDTNWQGEERKLLIQANRNGFFYVLDRTNGEFLLGEPFLEKLNWASGTDERGRPILNELPLTETGETYVCPSFGGGTNWYSSSYNPLTGLYYFQATEQCNLFSKRKMEWQAGTTYMGGTARGVPNEPGQKVLRALDIHTGEIVFDIEHADVAGAASAGVISTAAGLVFYGDRSGEFVAADASTGEILWQYPTNQRWRSSPMTYMFDNEQYVATAVGLSVTAFKLVAQ